MKKSPFSADSYPWKLDIGHWTLDVGRIQGRISHHSCFALFAGFCEKSLHCGCVQQKDAKVTKYLLESPDSRSPVVQAFLPESFCLSLFA